jgi:hypothetical protein
MRRGNDTGASSDEQLSDSHPDSSVMQPKLIGHDKHEQVYVKLTCCLKRTSAASSALESIMAC